VSPDSPEGAKRDVIFEYISQGAFTRVSAVDVASGIEAIAVCASSASRADMETLAMRKLKRLLSQQQQQQ
jgi:NAD(P)H-hydrate repair Nnr-like enzyme with NAD(P)H-hydrate epimerase domain